MANVVAIVGKSGLGKSTSIFPNEELEHIGLLPVDTVIVNVSGKPLPVKGGSKLYPEKQADGKYDGIANGQRQYKNLSSGQICDLIRKCAESYPEIKHIVIDDAQYIQGFEFMNRATEKGFDKFSEMGQHGFMPVRTAMTVGGNPDLIVFFIYHSDTDNKGFASIKTSGKLIDQHITMEGLFTVVLFAGVEISLKDDSTKYFFQINTDTSTTAKSPIGMFSEKQIPNDLGYVAQKVREYF